MSSPAPAPGAEPTSEAPSDPTAPQPTTAPTLVQRLAAEALGTFVLVLFGCSAALLSGGDYVAVALAFGLAVLCMAYAVGHISGGHFNPAVSLGAAVSGRMAWKDAGVYAGVQVLAGVLAALVLLVITKLYDTDGALAAVANDYQRTGGGWDWAGGFLAELIATAVFVFVILAVTDKRREGAGIPAPVVIGLALTLVHFGTLGLTGTSVNPARSIGPALFAGWDSLQQIWLFILAPLAGAALAAFGYPAVFGADRDRPARARRAPRGQPAPPAWDPAAQQQWAGGEPGQAWQQPPAPWGQPDATGEAQQWAGGTPSGSWGTPNPDYPQQGYPQQGYAPPGYDPSYGQGYGQGYPPAYGYPQHDQAWPPDPQASAPASEADDDEPESGRTQIRPAD